MARKSPAVPATDAEIREAFRNGSYKPSSDAFLPALAGGKFTKTDGYTPNASGLVRGRISAAVRADFTAVTKRPTSGEGVKRDARTVEVPRVSPKTGRPIKSVVIPLSQARELSGTVGRKGRLSREALAKVAAAL
jgi:hypothetical protein